METSTTSIAVTMVIVTVFFVLLTGTNMITDVTAIITALFLLLYKKCRRIRVQSRKGITCILNSSWMPDVIKTRGKKILYSSCLLSRPWTLELYKFDEWYEREVRCNAVDFEQHVNEAVDNLIRILRTHTKLNIKEVITVI